VFAIVTEPFSHGTAREGSKVLKGSGFGGGGRNDDGVFHGIVFLKGFDELGNGGTFLTDSDVDTVELLVLVLAIIPPLLVEDGVNGDGGFTGLTVTNDKLTLATTDGNHSINRLNTSHHGLVDRATGQDTRGLERRTATLAGLNGTLAVNRVTQSIYDTSEKTRADGDIDNLACTFDSVAFLDESIITEDGDTDVVSFQVEAHSANTRSEFHHLFGYNNIPALTHASPSVY
jgi:hypothetical protein